MKTEDLSRRSQDTTDCPYVNKGVASGVSGGNGGVSQVQERLSFELLGLGVVAWKGGDDWVWVSS